MNGSSLTPRLADDVVLLDHHDSYTWNLAHLVAGVTGALPSVVQHDEACLGDVMSHARVILSPGPGHPDVRSDFGLGRQIILDASIPVLGVCLGFQGMVSAFGGVVVAKEPAHGRVSRIRHDGRGVFRDVPDDFCAVRYHSLEAIDVPPCLEVSATSDDGVVMGVRHRSLPLEGVQFHPESVLSEHGALIIRNFLAT